jgi:hypothetical protein
MKLWPEMPLLRQIILVVVIVGLVSIMNSYSLIITNNIFKVTICKQDFGQTSIMLGFK